MANSSNSLTPLRPPSSPPLPTDPPEVMVVLPRTASALLPALSADDPGDLTDALPRSLSWRQEQIGFLLDRFEHICTPATTPPVDASCWDADTARIYDQIGNSCEHTLTPVWPAERGLLDNMACLSLCPLMTTTCVSSIVTDLALTIGCLPLTLLAAWAGKLMYCPADGATASCDYQVAHDRATTALLLPVTLTRTAVARASMWLVGIDPDQLDWVCHLRRKKSMIERVAADLRDHMQLAPVVLPAARAPRTIDCLRIAHLLAALNIETSAADVIGSLQVAHSVDGGPVRLVRDLCDGPALVPPAAPYGLTACLAGWSRPQVASTLPSPPAG